MIKYEDWKKIYIKYYFHNVVDYHGCVDCYGDLPAHDMERVGGEFCLAQITWDKFVDSIWNLSLREQKPSHIYFIGCIIETLWLFIIGINANDGDNKRKNKYYFGFADYDFEGLGGPEMVLINSISENRRYVGIFSTHQSFSIPNHRRLENGEYTNLFEEESTLIDECINDFDKRYEYQEKEPEGTLKYFYKYKPEELIAKVIPCFEENKYDVPFNSTVYHCDEYQSIIAKAHQLRLYAEDRGALKPLPKEAYRPRFKVEELN